MADHEPEFEISRERTGVTESSWHRACGLTDIKGRT